MTIETTPTVPVATPDVQPTGALPAIPVPEDLPDAVEIDLSDAAAPPIEKPVAAEHPPAEEPPAEEPTPRKPVPIRRQVQAAREAERAAVERAERAERERDEYRTRYQQADEAALYAHEQSVKRDLEAAKQELKTATTAGDVDAMTEAQTRLAKAAAEQNTVDAWKASHPKQPAVAEPQPQPRQEQPPTRPKLSANTENWISGSTWFQPEHPDFDQEMHDEARLFARRLERKLRASGKGNEIDSADYYRQIDAHIHGEFPDAFETAEPPTRGQAPPMTRTNSPVAPATRASPTAAANPNHITLSPYQRLIARAMGLTHQDGRKFTDVEHEREYAHQKVAIQKAQRAAAG